MCYKNDFIFEMFEFRQPEISRCKQSCNFRPPNSYILHCHGKCGLFTIYLKGNDMKNSEFGKS